MFGNVELAIQYRMRAREDVANLFDYSDYSVAQALLAMAYLDNRLGSEILGDARQKVYYSQLAMNICRQLNARHSDVYLRSLFITSYYPTTTKEENKELMKECDKIQKMPYDPLYSLDETLRPFLPCSVHSMATTTYSVRTFVRVMTGNANPKSKK